MKLGVCSLLKGKESFLFTRWDFFSFFVGQGSKIKEISINSFVIVYSITFQTSNVDYKPQGPTPFLF